MSASRAGQDQFGHGPVDSLWVACATVAVPTEGLSLAQKLTYYWDGQRPAAPRQIPTAGAPSPRRRETATDVAPPRGKDRTLYEHLQALGDDRWDASFADVEDILGVPLPSGARNDAAWWSNEAVSHSHARAWLAAGFDTADVNLTGERVVFVRSRS